MTQDRILALKRQKLSQMHSSVPMEAGRQTAHTSNIQVDTPQPLPAYPAAGAAPIEILRYQVPAGMSGALTALAIVHIGAAGSFVDGSGVLLWRVLINGVPQKGLENLYVQVGSQSQLSPMFLLLKENDLLQITAQVPAGAIAPAGNPFARIAGYLNYGGLGSQAPRVNVPQANSSPNSTNASQTSTSVSPTPSMPSPSVSGAWAILRSNYLTKK